MGPVWTGKNGFFLNLFVFANIFEHKVRKSRVSVVNNYSTWTQVFSRISSRKHKISRKSFCLFLWGTGGFFILKRCRKSRDIVPLKGTFIGTFSIKILIWFARTISNILPAIRRRLRRLQFLRWVFGLFRAGSVKTSVKFSSV